MDDDAFVGLFDSSGEMLVICTKSTLDATKKQHPNLDAREITFEQAQEACGRMAVNHPHGPS